MTELLQIFYAPRDVFQQPLGGGGRPAHPGARGSLEPFGAQLGVGIDTVAARIDAPAEIEEHLAVGAHLAGNEYYNIVTRSELRKLTVAGCNLGADAAVYG